MSRHVGTGKEDKKPFDGGENEGSVERKEVEPQEIRAGLRSTALRGVRTLAAHPDVPAQEATGAAQLYQSARNRLRAISGRGNGAAVAEPGKETKEQMENVSKKASAAPEIDPAAHSLHDQTEGKDILGKKAALQHKNGSEEPGIGQTKDVRNLAGGETAQETAQEAVAQETPKKMARAKKFEKPPTPSYHPMATRSRVKANPAFQNLLSQFEKNDAAVKTKNVPKPRRRFRSASPRTARSPSPSTARLPSLRTARSMSPLTARALSWTFTEKAESEEESSRRSEDVQSLGGFGGLSLSDGFVEEGARTPLQYLCEDGISESEYLREIQDSLNSDAFSEKLYMNERSFTEDTSPSSPSRSLHEVPKDNVRLPCDHSNDPEEPASKSDAAIEPEARDVETNEAPVAMSHRSSRRSSVLPSPINATTVIERVWEDAPLFDPSEEVEPLEPPQGASPIADGPADASSAASHVPCPDRSLLAALSTARSVSATSTEERSSRKSDYEQIPEEFGVRSRSDDRVEDGVRTPLHFLCEDGISEMQYLREIHESIHSDAFSEKMSMCERSSPSGFDDLLHVNHRQPSDNANVSVDSVSSSAVANEPEVPIPLESTRRISVLPVRRSSMLMSSINTTTVVDRLWADGPLFVPNEGVVPLAEPNEAPETSANRFDIPSAVSVLQEANMYPHDAYKSLETSPSAGRVNVPSMDSVLEENNASNHLDESVDTVGQAVLHSPDDVSSDASNSSSMDTVALKRHYRTLMLQHGYNPDDYAATRLPSDYEPSEETLSERSAQLPGDELSEGDDVCEFEDTNEHSMHLISPPQALQDSNVAPSPNSPFTHLPSSNSNRRSVQTGEARPEKPSKPEGHEMDKALFCSGTISADDVFYCNLTPLTPNEMHVSATSPAANSPDKIEMSLRPSDSFRCGMMPGSIAGSRPTPGPISPIAVSQGIQRVVLDGPELDIESGIIANEDISPGIGDVRSGRQETSIRGIRGQSSIIGDGNDNPVNLLPSLTKERIRPPASRRLPSRKFERVAQEAADISKMTLDASCLRQKEKSLSEERSLTSNQIPKVIGRLEMGSLATSLNSKLANRPHPMTGIKLPNQDYVGSTPTDQKSSSYSSASGMPTQSRKLPGSLATGNFAAILNAQLANGPPSQRAMVRDNANVPSGLDSVARNGMANSAPVDDRNCPVTLLPSLTKGRIRPPAKRRQPSSKTDRVAQESADIYKSAEDKTSVPKGLSAACSEDGLFRRVNQKSPGFGDDCPNDGDPNEDGDSSMEAESEFH